MRKICEHCNLAFNRKQYPSGRLEGTKEWFNRRFCSKNCCSFFHVGQNHPNYKDGFRRGHDGGYIRFSDGRYVHRVVVENHLKRKLETSEHIHHIDGNVLNNNISNLQIVNNSDHRKIHSRICKRDSIGRFV